MYIYIFIYIAYTHTYICVKNDRHVYMYVNGIGIPDMPHAMRKMRHILG